MGVGILGSVLERFEKTLLGVRVQLDAESRMLISKDNANDKDVAAPPHRVSRLLNSSRSLVIVVLHHYERCAAGKHATLTYTHTHIHT